LKAIFKGVKNSLLKFIYIWLQTLHSLCQDPASPGGANPTYAPCAIMSLSLTHLKIVFLRAYKLHFIMVKR